MLFIIRTQQVQHVSFFPCFLVIVTGTTIKQDFLVYYQALLIY